MQLKLVELSRDEITRHTLEFINSTLFKESPQLKEQAALIIVGSIALGDYDANSDIDLDFILPESTDNSKVKVFKDFLKKNNSQIEIRLARTYEILEQYLNWNDDFILGEYQNGIVLQDPINRFTNLMEQFKWYPQDILEAKVRWLFHEIAYSVYKDFQPLLDRADNNLYLENIVKLRVTRYLLTAIRLINSKYPIHDKKLFINTQKLDPNNKLISAIDESIKTADKNVVFSSLEKAQNELENQLIRANLLDRQPLDYWLSYSSKGKNKILFE